MMTVNEVSKLTGVSIRTLQYYDNIGLLKPAEYTESGYRLYDDAALERLQQILLFRELEFPLKDIKDIINSFGGETILVSHDVNEVLSMCEKVTEISAGVTDKTETIEEFKSKMKEIYKKAGLDIGRFNDHER